MPTVIDALLVTLGLDDKGYKHGVKEARGSLKHIRQDAEKMGKGLTAANKEIVTFFTKIRREVIGLGAVFLGGIGLKSFIEDVTGSQISVGLLSKNLDMNTRTLSAWQNMAEKLGGTSADVDQGLRKINDAVLTMRRTGDIQPFLPLLQAGVNLNKFFKSNNQERLLQLSDVFSKMPRNVAQNFGQAFGLSEGLINILVLGRKSIEQSVETQKSLLAYSEKQSDQALKLKAQWNSVQDSLTNVGTTILSDLTPALTKALGQMTSWVMKNKEWIETGIVSNVRDFAHWVASIHWDKVNAGFKASLSVIKELSDDIGGLVTISKILLGLWAANKVTNLLSGVGKISKSVMSGGAGIMRFLFGRAGMVGLAGLGGYELGDYLNKKFNISEWLVDKLSPDYGSPSPSAPNTGLINRHPIGQNVRTDVHINEVNVHTNATDAKGIASDIGGSLKSAITASQADTGQR